MGQVKYSYPKNKTEIQEWLSNVTSLKFRLEKRGEMKLTELQKMLEKLPKGASAFLTVGKSDLCVLVYTEKDRLLPIEVWKFTK